VAKCFQIILFWGALISFANGTEIIAHRGASGHAPENTVSAILKGIELNSHYIEVDVHMSADGEIVIFHDDTLKRTTNGTGQIKTQNLADLKKLDAGSWFSNKFVGEKIPTLREVLELDFKDSKLIIEIKNVDNIYPGIEKKIVDLVKKSKFSNQVIYKSFGTEVLKRFHDLDPINEKLYVTIGPVLSWFLIDDWVRIGSIYDLEFVTLIQIHRFFIRKHLVIEAHKRNKKIIAWDVHEPKHIERMKNFNVDIIETDFPDRINK
jgi:glycerophosphoryl diester phosphodiesterase